MSLADQIELEIDFAIVVEMMEQSMLGEQPDYHKARHSVMTERAELEKEQSK